MSNNQHNNGVALITVLLVVFLVSATATSLAALQQVNTRRSTLLAHQQQAKLYALGAEQWAARILLRDVQANDRDHLAEGWATLAPVLPVEGGTVSGRLQDLQGRFNLNNLITADGEVDEIQLAILQRLLQVLELDTGLADAIVDWLDEDQETRFPDGAEDSEYLSREPLYLAANRALLSISELRLIRGVDEQVFALLSPHVTTLPEITPLNINTANAPVLAAISDKLELSSAEELLTGRDEEGYNSVSEFLRLADLSEEDIEPDSLGLSSDFFIVNINTRVGAAQLKLSSLIHRTGKNSATIVLRSFGDSW